MASDLLILFVIGVFGGTLAGLIGIGGGIIYILALEVYLAQVGVLPKEIHQFTISNSLFAVFFASLSSSIRLIKDRDFYYKQVAIVTLGGSIFSVLMLRFFVNTPLYHREHFNIIVVCVLAYMLFRVIRKGKSKETNTSIETVSKKGFLLGGIGGGIIASLSGLGGGVIMMPVFNTMLKLDMKVCRSISLGVITITSGLMSINNFLQTPTTQLSDISQFGYLIPQITLPIIFGVLIGGQLGVIISKNLKSNTISIIYGVFLFSYIIKKAFELL